MALTVGQLIYTSFPKEGFRLFNSDDIPADVQDILVKQIVHAHWNPYDPPESDFRAVFVQQVSQQQTLFGWLLNDGLDDLGREHTPYCLSYYLTEPLDMHRFQAICAYLEQGPVTRISRQESPEAIADIHLPDVGEYEPGFAGVAIGAEICDRNLQLLENNHFIQFFTPSPSND